MKPIQPAIKNKSIQSIYELNAAFDHFSQCEAGIDGDTLWGRILAAILTRHDEAKALHHNNHPRPIWKLHIDDFFFYYQLLPTRVEVGHIVGTRSQTIYEPTQDLLAEFTAELE